MSDRTWDEIHEMLKVTVPTRTDSEWDEAKMIAMDVTLRELISKLKAMFPDA